MHLDASHNHLVGLPIGAANFWMHSLERLYLSHNDIVELTRSMTELSHLTVLDLAHNKIKFLPLTSHWTGSRINKLNLSYNLLCLLSHKSEQEQSGAKMAAAAATGAANRHASTVKAYVLFAAVNV